MRALYHQKTIIIITKIFITSRLHTRNEKSHAIKLFTKQIGTKWVLGSRIFDNLPKYQMSETLFSNVRQSHEMEQNLWLMYSD